MPNRRDPTDLGDDTLAEQELPDEAPADDENRKTLQRIDVEDRQTLTDIEYQRRPRDTEPSPFAGDTVPAAVGEELDLHTFQPSECADVVEEYVRAAHEQGLTTVRIIHGKGVGTLRRIVQSVLERHPAVASFKLGDEHSGSWGATLVELKPR
jgi:DNA-nicking Smr family endonuclease